MKPRPLQMGAGLCFVRDKAMTIDAICPVLPDFARTGSNVQPVQPLPVPPPSRVRPGIKGRRSSFANEISQRADSPRTGVIVQAQDFVGRQKSFDPTQDFVESLRRYLTLDVVNHAPKGQILL